MLSSDPKSHDGIFLARWDMNYEVTLPQLNEIRLSCPNLWRYALSLPKFLPAIDPKLLPFLSQSYSWLFPSNNEMTFNSFLSHTVSFPGGWSALSVFNITCVNHFLTYNQVILAYKSTNPIRVCCPGSGSLNFRWLLVYLSLLWELNLDKTSCRKITVKPHYFQQIQRLLFNICSDSFIHSCRSCNPSNYYFEVKQELLIKNIFIILYFHI